MTEQPQPTKLELYAQVIAAYQQASFWNLVKYAHTKSGHKWRAKNGFWIAVVFALSTVYAMLAVSEFLSIADIRYLRVAGAVVTILMCLLLYFELRSRKKAYEEIFAERTRKYGRLAETYGKEQEFYRYFLFQDELQRFSFRSNKVEQLRPLLDLDQQTLGSYIAQRPLLVWIASTLTAILVASATNWHPVWVGMVIVIGVLLLLILHAIPVFLSTQRRWYELRRWLAWYEADAPKLTPAKTDRPNPLPN